MPNPQAFQNSSHRRRRRRWAWAVGLGGALAIALGWTAYRWSTGDRVVYGLQKDDLSEFAVILVHGLDEPGRVWEGLLSHLRARGIPVVEFRYPNDQDPAESARFLAKTLENSPLTTYLLVGHSMGCLVVRHAFSEPAAFPSLSGSPDRCAGFLQLAPPNHGSRLARFRVTLELQEGLLRLGDPDLPMSDPAKDGGGEAGQALTPGSDFLQALNARRWPEAIPTAIVIGYDSPVDFQDEAVKRERLRLLLEDGAPPDFLFPEILDGYGDGSVAVASALLPGIEQVHFVDAPHRPLAAHPDTLDLVDAYLSDWSGTPAPP